MNARARFARILAAALLTIALAPAQGFAQSDWSSGIEVKKTPGAKANTTIIERSGKDGDKTGIKLVALLTADGQEIDQGLIWRIYEDPPTAAGKARLLSEKREASPVVKLTPGNYTINASFGRAHITRHISVKADTTATEKFVLNAGGLRVSAIIAGKPAPKGSVNYTIYSDDRDQFDTRTTVMSGAKPNLIIRLNAGIYRIVSLYGDANARVEADVTVEAGKLTEATITHSAGRATFRLVNRPGGDALPDTHWTILSENGALVKDSVGALPTHTLAPGKYTVIAKSSGLAYKDTFEVEDDKTTTVELIRQNPTDDVTDTPDGGDLSIDVPANMNFKNQ